MNDEALVPQYTDSYEAIWDDIGTPECETALLKAVIAYPGIDPYQVTSGGRAIDRWCNNLLRCDLIDGWEDEDGSVWVWATDKGKAMFG